MKKLSIAIFGASGATGKEVINSALKRGFNVNGYVRTLGSLSEFTTIREFSGGFENNELLSECLRNRDACIVVLGPKPPFTDVFCADATQQIIEQCKLAGVERIIVQTGALIGDYPDNQRSIFKVIGKRYEKKQPASYQDRVEQEALVRNSQLAWTIVKPPRLTNGKKKGRYKCAPELKCGMFSKISRKDLADCLVDLCSEAQYNKQVVFVKA